MKDITKYNYISFDIFDTLVVRNTLKPSDVYDIVESIYNKRNNKKIEGFKENIIKSQKNAIKNNPDKEEVEIDYIYRELSKYYPDNVCNKLLKYYKEVEINICVPNLKYKKIYEECLDSKKNIIITSDMYLDEETITKILDKCGYNGYKKLYLSSKYNKRKSTGNLYKYILNDLNISRRDIIHIGDNLISDNIIPNLLGIKTKRVINKNYCMFYNKKVQNKYKYSYDLLEKFISNNVTSDNSYYFNMGYETFGPILYGFSTWLSENIKTKRVFFLSRDGYIISKAFNLVNKKKFVSKYFYASRRALIIPTLWMDDDFKAMIDKLYVRDYIKLGNLYRKLGLEEHEYLKTFEKYGFKKDINVKYDNLFKDPKLISIFNDLKPVIHNNSKREYKLLCEYMKQEGMTDDCSIVDIGWNGNMQVALKNIINTMKKPFNIEGYYIGILRESKNIGKVKMNGYLFDPNSNYDIYICLKVINSIFESMFLAPHGSVKTYKKQDGIKPVLYPYEYENGKEQKAYQNIQNGAIKFIEDFTSSSLQEILNIDSILSFYNLQKFAYYPKMRDVNQFGDFKFLEDDIIYLAKPNKISKYIVNPTKFVKDFYLSGWVIGFLKRLTKVNCFYKQLYLIYIRRYLKKKK